MICFRCVRQVRLTLTKAVTNYINKPTSEHSNPQASYCSCEHRHRSFVKGSTNQRRAYRWLAATCTMLSSVARQRIVNPPSLKSKWCNKINGGFSTRERNWISWAWFACEWLAIMSLTPLFVCFCINLVCSDLSVDFLLSGDWSMRGAWSPRQRCTRGVAFTRSFPL